MTSLKEYNRRRVAAIVFLCMIFEGGGTVLISAAKAPLMQMYGMDIGQYSMLLTVRSIVCGVMPIFCGGLSDKIGRKKTIILGMLLFTVFYMTIPQVPKYQVLMIAIIILGIGYSLVDPSSQAILFDAYDHPGYLMQFVQVSFAAGGVIVPFIVSSVVKNGITWKSSFWIWLVFALFILVYTSLQRFPGLSADSEEKAALMEHAFRVEPKASREGLLICIFVVLNNIVNSAVLNYADLYQQTVFGLGSSDAIKVLSYYQLGCVLGALVSAKLVTRYRASVMMVAETAFACAALFAAIISGSNTMFTVAVICVGLGTGVQFSLAVSIAGELFWRYSGAATGAVSSSSAVGIALASIIGGIVIPKLGISSYYKIALTAAVLELVFAVIVNIRYNAVAGPVKRQEKNSI